WASSLKPPDVKVLSCLVLGLVDCEFFELCNWLLSCSPGLCEEDLLSYRFHPAKITANKATARNNGLLLICRLAGFCLFFSKSEGRIIRIGLYTLYAIACCGLSHVNNPKNTYRQTASQEKSSPLL